MDSEPNQLEGTAYTVLSVLTDCMYVLTCLGSWLAGWLAGFRTVAGWRVRPSPSDLRLR